MPNNFARPRPRSTVGILRSEEYGNNVPFIVDAFGDDKMRIIQRGEDTTGLTTIIRWGSTATIENREGVKLINTAKALKETNNKGAFRKKVGDLGPKYFDSFAEVENYDGELEAIIIRPRTHARSEHLYLCRTREEAEAAIRACENVDGSYYCSEYISKEKEYRVFVANGRAFMVFEKVPRNRNDISWGCVEQGQLKLINWSEWPLHIVKNAIDSFNHSSLDFGAVDVMEKNGRAYFLEINTAPEVWPYYGQKFAQVFKYMIEESFIGKGKRLTVTGATWKHFIHPAVTEKAIAG